MNADKRGFRPGDEAVLVVRVARVWNQENGLQILTVEVPGYAGGTINVVSEAAEKPVRLEDGGLLLIKREP